jgi:hypothetical protein
VFARLECGTSFGRVHLDAILKRLLFLFLVFAVPAFAQRTVVSGTVTDVNALPYSGASLTITLSLPTGAIGAYLGGAQIAGTVGPVKLDNSGSFIVQLPDNTLIQCANTVGQIVACAPQTTWAFAVTLSPGVAPPVGTGAQTCSATLTITGASQSVSGSFSACPALTRSTGGGFGGVNVQSGATYTPVTSDCGKMIVFTGAANVTFTLPNPPLVSTCAFGISDILTGSSIITLARNGLTINGAAQNDVVNPNNTTTVFTDGSNYFTGQGAPTSAANINAGSLQSSSCISMLGSNGDFSLADSCGLRQLGGNPVIVANGLSTGWLMRGIFDYGGGLNSRLRLQDQGTCTMAAGTCTAQALGSTYASAPLCFLTWTGSGTLTGILKCATTTTTVTPSSTVGTDTAVMNWFVFGI